MMGLASAGFAVAVSGETDVLSDTDSDMNRILNLYDNMIYEAGDAISDWGFSAYITYNGKTILFDAGTYPDIIGHNAGALGADLTSVDIAVLSHNHLDHINGFDYLLKINREFTFYLPNDAHIGGSHQKFTEKDRTYPRGYRYRHENSHFVTAHKEIGAGIHIIATTSPLSGKFSKYPPNENQPSLSGMPELSLALERGDGTVCLVSGCSHSKIEEIVKAAKQHLGKEVSLVIGGFHHFPYSSEYVTAIAKMMKDDLGVKKVACSHCTGEEAVKIFQDLYKNDYCGAGLGSSLLI